MQPTLCIVGGCNGAGKTTLARELLPRMGLMRFLNADEIARGLSPLDPTLVTFKAGRLLIEEARGLLERGDSFAIESALSGESYLAMLRDAKAKGYRFVLHYLMIGSPGQAVDRVALRVTLGGHDVPEDDVRRLFRAEPETLPGRLPAACGRVGCMGQSSASLDPNRERTTHSIADLIELLHSFKLMEPTPSPPDPMTAMVLEASRVATAKMLDYYKRMGIRVTPQMTLAPEPKKRVRKPKQ